MDSETVEPRTKCGSIDFLLAVVFSFIAGVVVGILAAMTPIGG